MKIAYIILAHKLPEQLVRLVKKLNTDSASFLIHIDKKTDKETYLKMVKPLSEYGNVRFLKRHLSNWGTFGCVQPVLDGIREALSMQVDYGILLTGQDYPIKSNEHIHKFFEESKGQSYFEYFALPDDAYSKRENGGMDRIDYWFLYFLGRPHKIFRRSFKTRRDLLRRYKLFGGSAYWCLTRSCLEFIDEYAHRGSNSLAFWKHTGNPDELFFQTILLNSHFKDQIINDNLRYIIWPNYPSKHPEILRKQDYERFVVTNKLFARKFDMTVDADVLDMIDAATS